VTALVKQESSRMLKYQVPKDQRMTIPNTTLNEIRSYAANPELVDELVDEIKRQKRIDKTRSKHRNQGD
jgi:hypothetical protein